MENTDTENVINGITQFTNQFYNVFSKTQGNILFSPLSVHIALAMVYQGANRETAQELSKTLKVSNRETVAKGYNSLMNNINNAVNVTVHTANKVYIMKDFPLRKAFMQAIRQSFLSEVDSVNFEENIKVADEINKWVEDKTNSKIKDLMKPDALNCRTRLVLINAIYFKGNWKYIFSKNDTREEPFYITEKESVECEMMHITRFFRYCDNSELDAQILRIDYENESYSMVIILPNQNEGIRDVENKLTNVNLNDILQSLNVCEVDVSLPKFKVEACIQLNDVLKQMGLELIFDEKKADFTDISESDEQLFVSEAIQKTFINVDESGTEAAAATAKKAIIPKCSKPWKRKQFVADHPFVFYLISKEELKNPVFTIIFAGRVTNVKCN